MINFKTEKEPKMILFDFGAFQKNMQMLSHDKIIAHMLFGVFHMTSRTITFSGWGDVTFFEHLQPPWTKYR